MTWLMPWALGAGALGMLGVVAAHLLARQRPRALPLATARFLPAGMLEATAVQPRPTDRWWMALRLLIIALLSIGVAQPVPDGTRVAVRTVLLLDRTLADTVQRRALASLAPTDAVIAFDTTAALRTPADTLVRAADAASLGSALALLARTRDSLSRNAGTLRVLLASPLAAGTLDAATPALRALLPDSIHRVAVPVVTDSARARGPIAVRADGDDPVAATATLLGDSVAPQSSRIVRAAALTRDDSAAARTGATVVHWPARDASGAPVLRGLTVHGATWVAPLQPDPSAAPRTTAAIGWWHDGQPAVWRERVGSGCVLQVRAAVPAAGDQTLSLGAQAWLAALLTSCDPASRATHDTPAWLLAPTATRLASVEGDTRRSAWAPWLLGAGLVLALLEMALRARRTA